MIWERLKEFLDFLCKRGFSLDTEVTVKARPLKPEEAIGRPEQKDFPIIKGKEKMMEARVEGFVGHAFTDMFGDFQGHIRDVLELPLKNNFERAVFIATLNAISRKYFGHIGTVHCRDKEPSLCAEKLLERLKEFENIKKISLFGFQPRIAEKLSGNFQLRVVDLDQDNIGKEKFGVTVEGPESSEDVISWGELILVTGTCFTNDTYEPFLEACREKRVIFYGVTGAGVAKILNLERFCPYSR